MERRDTLRGVIDRNGVDYEVFAKALREAYPDKEFTDRVIQRYLRQPLRSNYAIAAGVGQDKVLAIVRELRRGSRPASPLIPEESVDAMLARHQLDRREAAALWRDPMTSLEMFEGLTGLGSADIRKMCIKLSLPMTKPHIPQPEVTVPEDDPEPPSIVAQMDPRQMVEDALSGIESEPGEVLGEPQVPQRYSTVYLNATDTALEAGRQEIRRLGLTRTAMRQIYESREIEAIRRRYGWSDRMFYIVLGLLEIPLLGRGPRPGDLEPAPWPDTESAQAASEPEPEPGEVGRALIESKEAPVVSSNGTNPTEPAPPSLDAASATIEAMRARRRFVEERMVERRAELEALEAEYGQLRVAMEAMEALRAYYVPPQS